MKITFLPSLNKNWTCWGKIQDGLVILRMEDPGVLQVAQDSLVRDFERETPKSHCRFLYSMWGKARGETIHSPCFWEMQFGAFF